MKVITHADMDVVEWRQGVETRMLVSALTGSMQLCIFEQICDPGLGAPTHLHAVEEVLTVVEGRAEIWVGNDRTIAGAGHSVLIPAGTKHGFRNLEQTKLHMRATLAAPIFEASYEDRAELSRRYVPVGLVLT